MKINPFKTKNKKDIQSFQTGDDEVKDIESFIQQFTASEDKDLAIIKIAENLVKEEKKCMLSDLSEFEVDNFSVLYTLMLGINTDMKGNLLNEFIEKKLILKISKKRKGREELTELAKGLYSQIAQSTTGIMDRFVRR